MMPVGLKSKMIIKIRKVMESLYELDIYTLTKFSVMPNIMPPISVPLMLPIPPITAQ